MKTRMGNVILGAMVSVMAVVNFASADMVWVYINDPGVPGYEGFTGYMSKYETTNAQYCHYLNDALGSGDIAVIGNKVYGASGSNSGADYVGELYYDGDGPGYNHNGAPNGGAARINYIGGVFSVDAGFEDHPVTYVNWYGATAFCNYYGYRLPTEWEWQAVADYDGSFNYGCGTSINNSIANYYNSIHPDGTTIVGAFGTYGYGMCDLAGNLWEWTSSYDGSNLHTCGNSWGGYDYYASVSFRSHSEPSYASMDIGIRPVCVSKPAIEALVDIDPDTLNLGSKEKWVTCYIELPDGYDVMDIDGSTVMLDGISAYIGTEGWARAGANTGNIMDHDGDGILERMVKFDGAAVRSYLIGLGLSGNVGLTVTGDLVDGPSFEGVDVIRVIKGS